MSRLLFRVAYFAERMRSGAVRRANEILEKGNGASKKELEHLRDELLINLVSFLYFENAYYRSIMDQEGLHPSGVVGVPDLVKFPVLTKDLLKSARGLIETATIPGSDCIRRTSGGTTGEPVFVDVDDQCRYLELYAYYRGLKWMGYSVGDPMVKFFGGSLGGSNSPTFRNKVKKWITGEIFIPAFGLTKSNAREYLDIIRAAGRPFIQGYVSTIFTLATYAKELNYKGLKIRGVFTTAEQLSSHQAEFISEVFKCEVKAFYGCAEINCLGFQVKMGGPYVVPSELVYFETCRHPEYDIEGAFLITSLHNRKTPLLRYLNGDNGVLLRETDQYDLIDPLFGRTADMFISPDGNLVSSIVATQTMQLSGLTHKIRRYQLIQDEIDHVSLLLEPFEGQCLEKSDVEKLVGMYRSRLGQVFRISAKETSEFLESPGRKHRLMINVLRK